MEEDEIDASYSTHGTDEQLFTEFHSENLMGRDRLGDVGIHRRIIL
jgi:hypothetical protein